MEKLCAQRAAARSRSRGFTLIEAMVVVAIGAVLAAIAAPSFMQTIRSNRLDAAALDLRAATQLARSEAIKRARVVIVEPITAGSWTNGIRIYVDGDQNPSNAYTATGDTLIRENGLKNGGLTLSGSAPARFAFDGRGNNIVLAAAFANQVPTTSTLVFCAAPKARRVTVNNAGFLGTSDETC